MKFMVFLLVMLLVYQILIAIAARSLSWLFAKQFSTQTLKYARIGFWLLAESMAAALLLRHTWHHGMKLAAIMWVILFYITLFAITGKVLLLLSRWLLKEKQQGIFANILRWVLPSLWMALMAHGIYAAYNPIVMQYNITVDKPMQKPLRMVLASDLHLGLLVREGHLSFLQQVTDQHQADFIVLAGDIMDDNSIEYDRLNLAHAMKQLHAPMGVYAVMGNHDRFSHRNNVQALKALPNLTLLQDEVITLPNDINIIGRLDDQYPERKSTKTLTNKINNPWPILLIDHEPTQIQAHSKQKIDIQVSGHAHRGQIFPANLISQKIHFFDYGYLHLNNRHFFVTSGLGFWAVPLRIGTRSEVMLINIKSSKAPSQKH